MNVMALEKVTCRMIECARKGEPNYRCAGCAKKSVYFCREHQRELISSLRELGEAKTYCFDCRR